MSKVQCSTYQELGRSFTEANQTLLAADQQKRDGLPEDLAYYQSHIDGCEATCAELAAEILSHMKACDECRRPD